MNDLVLTATGVPAGQFGVFFYGVSQTQVPFGDGFKCVANPVFRLHVTATGAGTVGFPIDYGNPPGPAAQITPGSTWNFQFWYRDPAAGASGHNLSDGLELLFCP